MHLNKVIQPQIGMGGPPTNRRFLKFCEDFAKIRCQLYLGCCHAHHALQDSDKYCVRFHPITSPDVSYTCCFKHISPKPSKIGLFRPKCVDFLVLDCCYYLSVYHAAVHDPAHDTFPCNMKTGQIFSEEPQPPICG